MSIEYHIVCDACGKTMDESCTCAWNARVTAKRSDPDALTAQRPGGRDYCGECRHKN